MDKTTVICSVRYTVDQAKIAEFRCYAEAWVTLINRYGGCHHGYFASVPGPTRSVSFPSLGSDGPTDIVLANFSFPDPQAYEAYRQAVRTDPLCTAAEQILSESGCVVRYERLFLEPMLAGQSSTQAVLGRQA